MRILKQAICTLLFLTFFGQELFASVEEGLKKIPYQERIFLNEFFKEFFLHYSLGHVLFFDTKPACLTAYSITKKPQEFRDALLSKGWASWKKYEALFLTPILFLRKIASSWMMRK